MKTDIEYLDANDCPELRLAYRYGLAHGVELKDEYPFLVNSPDIAFLSDPDLELQPGMVLSLVSYIGEPQGQEGVKLEEQILITETGCDVLSTFPMENRLLD